MTIECVLCNKEDQDPGTCEWPICRTCQTAIVRTYLSDSDVPHLAYLSETVRRGIITKMGAKQRTRRWLTGSRAKESK